MVSYYDGVPSHMYNTLNVYSKLYIFILVYNIEAACSTSLYTCCRDGMAKENKLPKVTEQTRKHRGSRKLDAYCISRMTVKREKCGNVCVKYIRTHTNHTPGITELKHVPLPQAVREEVVEKYGQSVKLDSILDGNVYSLNTHMCYECVFVFLNRNSWKPTKS